MTAAKPADGPAPVLDLSSGSQPHPMIRNHSKRVWWFEDGR